jgi:hypothetical protein
LVLESSSNALRNDLIHPNEYVRGSTLRYLCKLKEPEVLEPLMPSVFANLEHRYAALVPAACAEQGCTSNWSYERTFVVLTGLQ